MNTNPTVYEMIRSFSVDEMAEFITDLCRERDLYCLERLQEAGIDASIVQLARELQVLDNKMWLLSKYSDICENS